MLFAAGSSVRFVLTTGRSRRGKILLHDEAGDSWPSSSGLVVPGFKHLGRDLAISDEYAQRYYGDSYVLKRGSVRLPPKPLSQWKEIGRVKEAFYVRRGDIEPGPKKHVFGESILFKLLGKKLPRLYKHGQYMRLELGEGAVWNWRGIVSP